MGASEDLIGRGSARAGSARHFGVLYGAFAVALGYGMLVPLVPEYLRAGGQGGDVALHTGALAAAFMAAASAAAPLWGLWSDRAGRKAVIIAGLAGASAAPIPFMLSQGLRELYAFQALAGAFFGAVAPASAALLFEDGEARDSGRRLARLGAATLAGYLAGPALGGWLAGMSESMSNPPAPRDIVFAALAVHASVVALAVPLVWLGAGRRGPSTVAAPGSIPPHGVMRGTVLALAGAMLAAFAVGGFEIATALHVRNMLALGSRAVAAVFIACAVGMLVAQLAFLPRFALREDRMSWALGLLLAVAGLVAAIPFAASQAATLAASGLIGAALGLAIALLGLQTAALTGHRRGLALGLQSSALNAGQAVGSLSAGTLFGALTREAFPALALGVALPAIALALLNRREVSAGQRGPGGLGEKDR